MKALIFSLLLVLVTTIGHAQEIELEEAKVGFELPMVQNGDSYSFEIKEEYAGEFIENPIAFMKANFDIKGFINSTANRNFDTFEVTFQCAKGKLEATYNKDGELVKTYQRFKDIAVPHEVKHELYRSYKGWSMTQNKYTASGMGEVVDKEVYKIKLENGNRTQRIKIDPKNLGRASVASNL